MITLLEKKIAYNTLISLHIARGTAHDAVKVCLEVLDALDIKFGCLGKPMYIVKSLIKTKMKVKSIVDQLSQLQYTSDESHIWAFSVLDNLLSTGYLLPGSIWLPLAIFKGLTLTLKWGISEYTPSILSFVGLLLNVAFGDLDGATRIAEMGEKILETYNCRKTKGRGLYVSNTFVLHWTRPMERCLKEIFEAHDLAVAAGDTENASMTLVMYVDHFIWTGGALDNHLADIQFFVKQTSDWKQYMPMYNLLRSWQIVFCCIVQMMLPT